MHAACPVTSSLGKWLRGGPSGAKPQMLSWKMRRRRMRAGQTGLDVGPSSSLQDTVVYVRVGLMGRLA